MKKRGIDRYHIPSYLFGCGVGTMLYPHMSASARLIAGGILAVAGVIGFCWPQKVAK